ncbi:hypothetical protein [Thiorhodococcus fuscus]|uniref:DUF2868 domain-containing protein n=1 Tax=Thiorhodococcus fuscus TaxID=527200 RepID=A0ABW4Y8F8_9GAMM
MTQEQAPDDSASASPTPQDPDALAHLFEDHLFQTIQTALAGEDVDGGAVLLEGVRKAIASRLEVIAAGKEFVKLMLSGNAAAILLLVAFIYQHHAISVDLFLTKLLVVVASLSLVLALFLTFSQLARLSAQEQMQKWRIALADAGNWQLLVMMWRDARADPVVKKLVSAEVTVRLELLILLLWGIGGFSVMLAWMLSFF